MRAEEGRLLLLYGYRSWGCDGWQEIEEPAFIEWTPCHFGGARPWFVCPGIMRGVACRRRVGKLYGAGRYFLCRHCYRLGHASQREDEWGRHSGGQTSSGGGLDASPVGHPHFRPGQRVAADL
jgi:hypothetical protein